MQGETANIELVRSETPQVESANQKSFLEKQAAERADAIVKGSH